MSSRCSDSVTSSANICLQN